jgi:hypothetical protein
MVGYNFLPLPGTKLSTETVLYVCVPITVHRKTHWNCTKCRGILAPARLQALSRVETNEASSRELMCATHDLAPPFRRPCGRQHKGISIKNNNQAAGDTTGMAALVT